MIKLGALKERQAVAFLKKHQVQIIERNYRSKMGEIDIIGRELAAEPVLLFIEVRYRKSTSFGGALYSIDHGKQQKLIKTASHYLQQQNADCACRFDVITFEGKQINWIKNAFST